MVPDFDESKNSLCANYLPVSSTYLIARVTAWFDTYDISQLIQLKFFKRFFALDSFDGNVRTVFEMKSRNL